MPRIQFRIDILWVGDVTNPVTQEIAKTVRTATFFMKKLYLKVVRTHDGKSASGYRLHDGHYRRRHSGIGRNLEQQLSDPALCLYVDQR